MSRPFHYADDLDAWLAALLQLQLPGVSRIPGPSKADLTPSEGAEPGAELDLDTRRTLNESARVDAILTIQQLANASRIQQRDPAALTPEQAEPGTELDLDHHRTFDETSRVDTILTT